MTNKLLQLVLFIGLIVLGGFIFFWNQKKSSELTQTTQSSNVKDQTDIPSLITIAEGLDTPWAITFLPDNSMLVTERVGRVRVIDSTGKLQNAPVVVLSSVKEMGEGGLMGITIHPDFSQNSYVYLYYTYGGSGSNTLNRVVRMTYKDNKLTNEQIIVDQIPGALFHNGGRIKFGPDKNLYITTGDAQEPSRSQDKNSLAGKILRVTDEGKAASGNPFNNLIYSYGHRNPQGITWDSIGILWETEHGPSGGVLGTGNDEINKIEMGKNYGWPEIQGDQTKLGMELPVRHSGRNSTWAPAGTEYVKGSIYFGGLRGQALYKTVIQDEKVTDFKEYFKGQFGRIREVILGPDNMLYITTSNKDGRGNPTSNDDRVIKVNLEKL